MKKSKIYQNLADLHAKKERLTDFRSKLVTSSSTGLEVTMAFKKRELDYETTTNDSISYECIKDIIDLQLKDLEDRIEKQLEKLEKN